MAATKRKYVRALSVGVSRFLDGLVPETLFLETIMDSAAVDVEDLCTPGAGKPSCSSGRERPLQ